MSACLLICQLKWKFLSAGGEGDIVGITRISTFVSSCKTCQPNVKNVRDDIRNNRRAWAPLWQDIFVARDLRNHCRDSLMKGPVMVLNKNCTNATEVNRREEIL